MPEPTKGEPLNKFVQRFMGSEREQKYPQKQRAALGYSEYRRTKKKRA